MWVWFRPLYQNEVKCSAFDMVFHKKGCAHGLIMKVRVFGTQKRPICFVNSRVLLQVISKLFKLGSFKTFKKQVLFKVLFFEFTPCINTDFSKFQLKKRV